MKGFGLTHAEVIKYKKDSAEALRKKNENVISIHEPGSLLEAAVAMLETCSSDKSLGSIVLPLLLVSGRRTSELLNARSTFAPAPSPYYTFFTGQLKTKGKSETYMIPLLCPYSTFCIGLNAMREKIGETVSELTEKQINQRFQSKLQLEINRGALPHLPQNRLLPSGKNEITPHSLRSMYTAFVFHCFTVPCTFNRMCMRICGHAEMSESLCYNAMRLEGGAEVMADLRGKFGVLHQSSAPPDEEEMLDADADALTSE